MEPLCYMFSLKLRMDVIIMSNRLTAVKSDFIKLT
jgi:hypothetical protein